MAFSKGLQNEIRNKTIVFNGQILITPFENNESQFPYFFKNSNEVQQQIQKHTDFQRMHAVAIKAGMLKANDDLKVLLKGVRSDFNGLS